jgi:hypothetical protein
MRTCRINGKYINEDNTFNLQDYIDYDKLEK